jgi:hypothetical protein
MADFPKSFEMLRLTLDRIFAHKRPDDHEKIEKGLSLFGTEADFARVIRSVLSKPDLLCRICASSYIHANGFYKIVLLSSDERDYKLRLHVWPPRKEGRPYRRADIHDHRWDFGSLILAGSYTHEEYKPNRAGILTRKYEYVPLARDGLFNLRYLGEARLKRTFRCLMVAGTRYTLDAGVLHYVVQESEHLTATLVLRGKRSRRSTFVFSRRQKTLHQEVASTSLTTEALRSVLQSLIALL